MTLYRLYLKFCASINYFFERKMGYSDAGLFALLFVTVVQSVYSFAVLYFIELVMKEKLKVHSAYYYMGFAILVALNYLFAFRKEQLYVYYKQKLNVWATIAIILMGYALMGILGDYARGLHKAS